MHLHSYVDVDWAINPLDCKSISCFCTYFRTTLISWTEKKLPTIAQSSTEVDQYGPLASAITEIIRLCHLLKDFQIAINTPTPVYCDNLSAISIAKNPILHARRNNVKINYHFIHQHVLSNNVQILHINSNNNLANILNKSLSKLRYARLRYKLTIHPKLIGLRAVIKHS